MCDSYDLWDDGLLIARFCGGDIKAWDVLYDRHQEKLLLSIKRLLNRHGLKSHLAEDVAQDVWLVLVRGVFARLKRYDPTRGGFDTYLQKLARRLIRKRYGNKGRTRKREVSLAGREPLDPGANDALVNAEAAEFMEDLTHQESRCLHEKLMSEPPPATEPPISAGNERVLKHRLQQKLRDHLDLPSE